MKLSVRVQPREPRLSDLVEMDVTVESVPDVIIKPPAFGQAVGDFLIRDYTERPAEPGAQNVRRFHYQLEPAHAGKHLIRSVSIEFVDKRPKSEGAGQPALIETDPLEVNVTSEVEGEAPNLAKLEPMVPPQSVPQVFSFAWLVAALGLGTARSWPSFSSAGESRGQSSRAARRPKKSPRPRSRSCWPKTCRPPA